MRLNKIYINHAPIQITPVQMERPPDTLQFNPMQIRSKLAIRHAVTFGKDKLDLSTGCVFMVIDCAAIFGDPLQQ